jgi:DNA-binding PadR family transcriptional regulator
MNRMPAVYGAIQQQIPGDLLDAILQGKGDESLWEDLGCRAGALLLNGSSEVCRRFAIAIESVRETLQERASQVCSVLGAKAAASPQEASWIAGAEAVLTVLHEASLSVVAEKVHMATDMDTLLTSWFLSLLVNRGTATPAQMLEAWEEHRASDSETQLTEERLVIDRSRIYRLCKDWEGRGFISQAERPDGRSKPYQLTERGKSFLGLATTTKPDAAPAVPDTTAVTEPPVQSPSEKEAQLSVAAKGATGPIDWIEKFSHYCWEYCDGMDVTEDDIEGFVARQRKDSGEEVPPEFRENLRARIAEYEARVAEIDEGAGSRCAAARVGRHRKKEKRVPALAFAS